MRKRILGGVVLALSGALLLTVLNLNFLVRRNKDYLIGQAGQALGRKITVDEIGVTLWPVGARLVNFALADDPAFSADAFLRAKDLRVDLRLLPLLVGRFRLKRMVIESPLITIVRDARGRYNFASHADNEKNDRARTDRGKEASSEKQDGTLFLVASLNVSDSTLHYRDVHLDGEIGADALDLGKVNTALPQFRKALPEALRFDGVYTIKDLKFKGTLNNLSLKGAVSGTDASFRFE